MSFLSDLFEGHTSNLGNDLNPSNIFSDTTKDIGGKNTIPELLGAAALATGGIGLAGGFGALGADLGITGGVDAADAAATGADASLGADAAAGGLTAADAADASALPDWLGTTSFGSSLDAATGASLPASATLDSLTLPSAASASADASGIDSLPTIGSGTDAGAPLNLLSGTATPATGGASGSGGFLNQLISGASNSITKNPLGIGIAAAGLGYDVLKGNPNTAAENQLNSEAQTLTGQGQQLTGVGQQLTSYLQSGTLPPGQQAAVTQAVQAAKARIIANAAANGQNTNPAQNSGLAQDLAAADQQGLATAGTLETQLAQTGTQLISTGLNATGLSSEIYQALVKIDQNNNSTLMSAIASMAAALGGGTKIQIGGTSAAA